MSVWRVALVRVCGPEVPTSTYRVMIPSLAGRPSALSAFQTPTLRYYSHLGDCLPWSSPQHPSISMRLRLQYGAAEPTRHKAGTIVVDHARAFCCPVIFTNLAANLEHRSRRGEPHPQPPGSSLLPPEAQLHRGTTKIALTAEWSRSRTPSQTLAALV